MNTRPIKLNIIQVYAPTTEAADQEIEEFYEEVERVLQTTKCNEINIIMGDFNAKIGRGRENNIVGPFGLGIRNERGDRLVEFCSKYKFTIANTWSDQPKRRLYTWKAPGDRTDRVIRNQIDYILINDRYKNMVTKAKTHPGADCGSDHNLLINSLNLKLKKISKEKLKEWTKKNLETKIR